MNDNFEIQEREENTEIDTVESDVQRAEYVIFKNKGLIDIRAITTFGISAKDPNNANPIGFFGTGLKYAIAVLLREEIPITILSGLSRYEFVVKKEFIRGKEFSFVCLNGEPLGFTTELGKNWELWQAFRELYSNCVDEFGKTEKDDDFPEPLEGITQVIVHSEKFVSIFENRSSIFLQGDPLIENAEANIHGGTTNNVFYRGIRIGTYKTPFMYKYNIQKQLDLTEDRTVKYDFQINDTIVDAVLSSKDEKFIESILTAPETAYEAGLNFLDNRAKQSDEFRKVAAELRRTRPEKSNQSAISLFERDLKIVDKFKTFVPTKEEQVMVAQAIDFLAAAGIIVDEFPILFVETLGESTLAVAEDGKMVLSQKLLNMGKKMVVLGLYEEYVHLKYGFTDCSRAMQSFLFETVIGLTQIIKGETL